MQPTTLEYQQVNLGLSIVPSDHDYCGEPPKLAKCKDRLEVQESQELIRVEVASFHLLEYKKELSYHNTRSVCIRTIPSSSKLCGMEAKSK